MQWQMDHRLNASMRIVDLTYSTDVYDYYDISKHTLDGVAPLLDLYNVTKGDAWAAYIDLDIEVSRPCIHDNNALLAWPYYAITVAEQLGAKAMI